jgi:hypothetical protein
MKLCGVAYVAHNPKVMCGRPDWHMGNHASVMPDSDIDEANRTESIKAEDLSGQQVGRKIWPTWLDEPRVDWCEILNLTHNKNGSVRLVYQHDGRKDVIFQPDETVRVTAH